MIESGSEVHTVVRAKLAAGALPRAVPLKMWVGFAKGDTICTACDDLIGQGGVEYEPEFGDGSTRVFHQKCLGVWHEERARV